MEQPEPTVAFVQPALKHEQSLLEVVFETRQLERRIAANSLTANKTDTLVSGLTGGAASIA